MLMTFNEQKNPTAGASRLHVMHRRIILGKLAHKSKGDTCKAELSLQGKKNIRELSHLEISDSKFIVNGL